MRRAFEDKYNHEGVYESYLNSLLRQQAIQEGETIPGYLARHNDIVQQATREYLVEKLRVGSDQSMVPGNAGCDLFCEGPTHSRC